MEIYDRIYERNRRNGDKNFEYAVHDLADIGWKSRNVNDISVIK